MHKQNFPINQLHQQYKYIAFTTAYSHSEHWLTFRMSHARMLRHLVLTMQQEWLTAVMETQHSLDFLHKNRDCRWAFGAAIRQCLGCIPPISEQLLLIQVLLLPSQFPTNACHAKQRWYLKYLGPCYWCERLHRVPDFSLAQPWLVQAFEE